MSVPMKWPLILAVIAGLIFVSAGVTLASSGISISAPCSVLGGTNLTGSVTSNSPGIEVVITDDDGAVIYSSASDCETDEPDPSGAAGYSVGFDVNIPVGTPGPLTITATDAAGHTTTKTVTIR